MLRVLRHERTHHRHLFDGHARFVGRAGQAYQQTGSTVAIQSVGGVDAAKRVQAGEAFDAVFLASDAIDRLIASGHVAGGAMSTWCARRWRSPCGTARRDLT